MATSVRSVLCTKAGRLPLSLYMTMSCRSSQAALSCYMAVQTTHDAAKQSSHCPEAVAVMPCFPL